MAYGLEATVTMQVGGVDTEFFTSANIVAAIAEADKYVDRINSNAAAETKTICSNRIAKRMLLDARNNSVLKGLFSDGGRTGSSGKSRISIEDYVEPEVYDMLQSMPDVKVENASPDEAGDV